jgi:hypothetical protein
MDLPKVWDKETPEPSPVEFVQQRLQAALGELETEPVIAKETEEAGEIELPFGIT